MTIIQQLIYSEGLNGNLRNVIERCLGFDELDKYLFNLDQQARLAEYGDLSCEDISKQRALEHQFDNLTKILQSKVLETILANGCEYHILLNCAIGLKNKLSDVDIIDYGGIDNKVYKIYIILKMIVDNSDFLISSKNSLLI